MSTNIYEKSIEVFCKMVMDGIRVDPDTRPALLSLIETFMDNNVTQEACGAIFFRVWQRLQGKSC